MRQKVSQDALEQKVKEFTEKDHSSLSAEVDLHFGDVLMRLPVATQDGLLFESTFCHGYQEKKYLLALSVQVGCASGCTFCELGEAGYKRNLTSDELLDQLATLLDRAILRGYDVFSRPLKATFVMGGEPLANPNFPDAIARMADDIPLQLKISTIFPDSDNAWKIYERLVEVAKGYPNIIQPQFSINSTDEGYRQGLAKIPLAGFEKIRKAGELWMDSVPDPRKVNLTFTLNNDTLMNPESIRHILSPDVFAVRLRDWLPTAGGSDSDLKPVELARLYGLRTRFEDLGYFFVPGMSQHFEHHFELSSMDLFKFYSKVVKQH